MKKEFLLFLLLFSSKASIATIDFTKIEKSIVKLYSVDIGRTSILQGTGFFIDSVTIVTNYHVINIPIAGRNQTGYVKIELNSGEVIYPNYAKFDSIDDIALLKIGEQNKQESFLQLSFSKPKIGDFVWTVGNPEGLKNTWSNGIISALRASDPNQLKMPGADYTIYQFTAPISEGSSGAPCIIFPI